MLKNVNWVGVNMDLISVSIKKPFILDVPVAQIVILVAMMVGILPVARWDIIAI